MVITCRKAFWNQNSFHFLRGGLRGGIIDRSGNHLLRSKELRLKSKVVPLSRNSPAEGQAELKSETAETGAGGRVHHDPCHHKHNIAICMPLKCERFALFLLSSATVCRSSRGIAFKQRSFHSSSVRSHTAASVLLGIAALPPATSAVSAASEGKAGSVRDFCSMVDGEFSSRSVDEVVLSRAQSEGVGATVRRSIGGGRLRNFDPFLMLDEFDVGPPAGFPDHPHRGFETVTYMLKGTVEHEDFVGHRGKIGPGSLQWMTAGKGIVHSEMPAGDERGLGLQLWVNLKSKDKMVDPAYQELNADEIPKITNDGVTAIVIAGEALGIKSPVYTRTPTHYIHFKMDPNSELKQPIPSEMNSFMYILEGKAAVGAGKGAGDQIDAHNTITLTKDGSGVTVKTFDSSANFVLISGEPTNEPIVQHGPFVMNTRQEIQQAMLDYSSNANGFENAARWYSQIGLPLTRADRRR